MLAAHCSYRLINSNKLTSMLKSLLCAGALFSTFTLGQAADEHTQTWLELSVHSQNVGQRIHLFGVDADAPDPKKFKQDIKAIDALLDSLVKKGVLKKARFELKPELEIEESLVVSVGELMKKHAPQYGIYVIREMMDIGARQWLSEFKEDAPLELNVRLPEPFLKEFQALLKKNGFQK